MAVGAAIVVLLAVITVVVTRPSGGGRPAGVTTSAGPVPLAECQSAIAARTDLNTQPTCGYETAGTAPGYPDGPAADPNDPAYAGAALATDLSTGGRTCVAGEDRPVLDTVRPVLSASFVSAPELSRIESTFQVTGLDGSTGEAFESPGMKADPSGRKVMLELMRVRDLAHGESYRWRVRGLPPGIGGGGWSPWCEFTIGVRTSDDLGLDDAREYPVVLAAAKWRAILEVLGPDATFVPIADALKGASRSAARVSVTLTGQGWDQVVNGLAYRASERDSAPDWELADLVSAALDGPEHPTMGHPRA